MASLLGLVFVAPREADATVATTTAPTASDEVRPTVVIQAPMGDSAIVPLLRAELMDLGFSVVLERYEGDSPGAPLGSAANPSVRREGASFRIVVHRERIDVTILDPVTNEATLREVFASADGSPVQVRTAVLHAVELLRWKLRDSESKPAPSPIPKAIPERPLAVPTPQPREWFVAFTPFVLHSPGGTEPGMGVGVELTWRPRRIGLRLLGATSLYANAIEQPEGKALATPRFAGLEGVLSLLPPRTRLKGELAAGIHLVSVRLRGTTDLPLQTHEDHLVTVAPAGGARLGYALGDTVSLFANAAALMAFRSDSIRIDDREVGRYGRLFLILGLGFEASLF